MFCLVVVLASPHGTWDHSCPGPAPPALEVQCLNCWTTREVPDCSVLMSFLAGLLHWQVPLGGNLSQGSR